MIISKGKLAVLSALCVLNLGCDVSYSLDKTLNIEEEASHNSITLRNIRKDTPVEGIEVFTNDPNSPRINITDMFRITSNFADEDGNITVLIDKGGCINMPEITDIIIRVIYPDNTSKDISYSL